MKLLRPPLCAVLFFLAAVLAMMPAGCATGSPVAQNVATQTLKATGHIAEAAVATAGRLYQDKQITEAQLRTVIDYYDAKFQPAFRIALAAVEGNTAAISPNDLVALAAGIAELVAKLKK